MTKPLSITSPTHAWALSSYFMLGFAGVAGVLDLNSQSAVINAMGDSVADIWNTMLMLSGLGSLVAAIAASRTVKPEYNLMVEMFLNITIFISLLYFLIMVIMTSGPRGFTTGVFALVFIMGSGMRAWQIRHELNLIKAARANPTEADPVMGDPRDESEQR